MLEGWMKEAIPEVTLEMIPDGIFRSIAEKIGIPNLIEIAFLNGGQTLYIPKPELFLRSVRDDKIRKEYNGLNCLELTKKYGISERWVNKLTETSRNNSI